MSGGPLGIIIALPYQFDANVFHHSMSEQNSALRRMWWCWHLVTLSNAMALRRNALPGLVIEQAYWRVPMRD